MLNSQYGSGVPWSPVLPVIFGLTWGVDGYASPQSDDSQAVTGLDMITIIMNYHDIAYIPVDRAKMNRRLFNALIAGGQFVVMDHSAKPGSGISAAKSFHRIDEKVVLDEFRQAGFKLEQEGDSLKNPADPRDQNFFNTKIPDRQILTALRQALMRDIPG